MTREVNLIQSTSLFDILNWYEIIIHFKWQKGNNVTKSVKDGEFYTMGLVVEKDCDVQDQQDELYTRLNTSDNASLLLALNFDNTQVCITGLTN